jgi:hypothetical protein
METTLRRKLYAQLDARSWRGSGLSPVMPTGILATAFSDAFQRERQRAMVASGRDEDLD